MNATLDARIASLNAAQARAVLTRAPIAVVIAGAGSGKTRVLTERVVRLLAEGVSPDRLLCVTFTRAAAAEMRERIGRAMRDLGMRGRLPTITTLHAWGLRLLLEYPEEIGRSPHFTVYDETDREDVLRAAAVAVLGPRAERARLATLERDPNVMSEYVTRLARANAIDFNAIEDETLRLLSTCKAVRQRWISQYDEVLVDEFQDTNLAQVAIVNHLTAGRRLFVVGDPRQSIYSFRGAVPATIGRLAQEAGGELIELVTNYRSVPAVVTAANALIGEPWAPMVAARDGQGTPGVRWRVVADEPVAVADLVVAAIDCGVPPGEIAVIGRRWREVDAVRAELVRRDIAHRYYGAETDPWATSTGRGLARLLLLARSPNDDNLVELVAPWLDVDVPRTLRPRALRERRSLWSLVREESLMFDAIGAAHAAWVAAPTHVGDLAAALVDAAAVRELWLAEDLTSRVALLDALFPRLAEHATLDDFHEWWTTRGVLERHVERNDVPALLTVHAAKGLEWQTAILVDVRDGVYPAHRGAESDAEDLRVLYVGVTRARDELVLVRPRAYTPSFGPPYPKVANASPLADRMRDPEAIDA